ncbi:MAG: hypothetical protein MZU79_01215 [Anaerotruncus sp.]|nr:hypothetical protein [Anaerotruncus sp.]
MLRDPRRNFLHDYLNQGEDQRLPAEPDCADLPYFLRAYFAWKLGLPDRVIAPAAVAAPTRPPRCDPPEIDRSFVGTAAPPAPSARSSRRIMDRVTSGSGRTALARRRHRLLPGAARALDPVARHRLRRSLRAHPDHRQMGSADGGARRIAPRGGCPARQFGGPQALLGG